jgi:hypothetical protein
MIGVLMALVLSVPGGGASGPGADPSPHFDVTAQFRATKAGAGEVSVTFAPKDPDVHINTTPPPKLKLEADQKVLALKAEPRPAPAEEKYLDTMFPVVFPVSVLAAPAGQTVKGSLTYYYCSQRQGWCRKGTAALDIPVKPR